MIPTTCMGHGGPEKQDGGAGKDHLRQEPNHECGVRPRHCAYHKSKSTGSIATTITLPKKPSPMQAKKRVRVVNRLPPQIALFVLNCADRHRLHEVGRVQPRDLVCLVRREPGRLQAL
jgi:hypothetical protein